MRISLRSASEAWFRTMIVVSHDPTGQRLMYVRPQRSLGGDDRRTTSCLKVPAAVRKPAWRPSGQGCS